MPSFRLHAVDTGEDLAFEPRRLIVAGYTGRDAEAVRAHIAELAAIGVPEPASIPTFYDLDPALLTTGPLVEVTGENTSGEAEPVLVRHAGRHYLGVGSDHTDRDLERTDIGASKAACPKPFSSQVVTLPAEAQWDGIELASTVDGVDYQRGTLAALRTPDDLLARLADTLGELDGDLVVFGGTLPLLTGDFRPGTGWRTSLRAGEHTLTCSYETKRRTT
ncbi:DUF2848 family protein [Pseudonocardia acaciae]|uniref:DUF2848 family protein n=1 Tax=Pseudonocardia acaciae TaxID=551276 RepID=UPI00048CBC03|nr:DUF2848 family protein [Pseudonocardia acaciae]